MQSYKVMILAHGETEWVANGLRFATEAEAEAYAVDLAGRWTMVKEWRVEESTDGVNK